MRKLFTNILLIVALVLSSCAYDDTAVWNKLENHESRISALEELCREMNTNISALQSLVDAMQGGDYITSIVPVTKDGNIIGYTITFAENDPITIYHGTNGKDGANGADGKDGYTPVIGVKQDSDGIYYWTLDGAWLLDDNGNKIKAVGTDGKDGANGADGKDGHDGVTPRLKIENDYWYVSYDNGTTWTELGKATGENDDAGNDEDSLIADITVGEDSVTFTLADGTVITLPLAGAEGGDDSGDIVAGSNKIYYTTADNKKMFPTSTEPSVFGAILISNVYKDGQGILTFDDTITSIGKDAFSDCTALTSITIPDSVTTIGDNAFSYCDSLTSVTIPDSVTTIGQEAFFSCGSLTSVTIGNGVTSIGDYAFHNCDSLTIFYGKFASEDNRCLIVDGKLIAFAPAGLIEYTIPDSVTSIGDYAFWYCTSLTSVTIPDSVTSIGYGAFENCTSLESVTIGNGVTSIGDFAFYGCSSLTIFYGKFASEDNRCLIVDGKLIAFAPAGLIEYTIPDSVIKIGNSVFDDCSSLRSITIPDSVTSIGQEAFRGCFSLTSVTIPDSVTSIGPQAFCYCDSLTSVTIGNGVTEIGDSAFVGCSSLTIFYGKFASEDNRCLIVDGKLIAFAPAGLIEYTIPDSVNSIGDYTFYMCDSLESVTIPDSVTSIGTQAFYFCCSMTSVTIGNSVTEIGWHAFGECTSLTSVTIPDSVTSIGNAAFYSCDSLTSVYCKATTPPAGGYDMFYRNASERKIYVPTASVEAYKSAGYWRDYASDIVGYEF